MRRTVELPYGYRYTFSFDGASIGGWWEGRQPKTNDPATAYTLCRALIRERDNFLDDVCRTLDARKATIVTDENGKRFLRYLEMPPRH